MNIANILKDKPKGTKLYSPICGELTLDEVRGNIIYCKSNNNHIIAFTEDGICQAYELWYGKGECLLFPSKQMRDWKKFQWKKGDVLVNNFGDHCIFKDWSETNYTKFSCLHKSGFLSEAFVINWAKETDESLVKQFILDMEKVNCGKLNLSTLEIEKRPKFKDGDIVYTELKSGYKAVSIFQRFLCQNRPATYVDFFLDEEKPILADYDDGYNILCESKDIAKMKLATEEEKNLLLSKLASIGKKWNPDTKQLEDLPKPQHKLKPFQKVLIRDKDTDKWRANIFSNYKEDRSSSQYVCVFYDWQQCIPYEGNEHLLGTTNSPKEGGE